ncbi:MAG: flagellar brake protein [Pseudomonadota bacterium]
MDFKAGLMMVILSPFDDFEIYGNIIQALDGAIALKLKAAGQLKAGMDISCLLFDDTEIYEFYSKVVEVSGTSLIVEKPEPDGLLSIEKRRFARVDCEMGFVARLMYINNISVEKLAKSFTGTIKNISAGGVLMTTNLRFPKDTIFTFKLKISSFIDCIARVRRVTELPGDKMYEIGCEFMNMNIDNIKAISMFTFKEQLKKRRKELKDSLFK